MAFSINLKVFREFFRSGSIGGIILMFCVVVALAIANSPLGVHFDQLLNYSFGYENEQVHLKYPTILWINDGLMAIFFLLVGLEIKRELVEGELSSFRKASLPLFAAFGGAVVPAAIFLAFTAGQPVSAGWGIPMATDIAFALGVLSLLGSRVPTSLKVFLAALAIVDDLIAILVIAIFYSTDINFVSLLISLLLVVSMLLLNRFKVMQLWPYLGIGVFLWYFIHSSGVHATIAGVLTAATIPTTKDATESLLEKLEHALTKPVNFLIMPIFALANTNIRIESSMFAELANSMSLGIILGLIVGKPVGITLMSWLLVKLRLGSLPQRASWRHIVGLGFLGGIGFTMSIFISLLSYSDEVVQTEAKLAILVASLVAGVAGFVLLSSTKPDPANEINSVADQLPE